VSLTLTPLYALHVSNENDTADNVAEVFAYQQAIRGVDDRKQITQVKMRRHQSAGGPDQLQGHVYQMHISKLVYNFVIDGGTQHCFSRFDNKQIWCIAADSIPQN
jgi:hypothetical protein